MPPPPGRLPPLSPLLPHMSELSTCLMSISCTCTQHAHTRMGHDKRHEDERRDGQRERLASCRHRRPPLSPSFVHSPVVSCLRWSPCMQTEPSTRRACTDERRRERVGRRESHANPVQSSDSERLRIGAFNRRRFRSLASLLRRVSMHCTALCCAASRHRSRAPGCWLLSACAAAAAAALTRIMSPSTPSSSDASASQSAGGSSTELSAASAEPLPLDAAAAAAAAAAR